MDDRDKRGGPTLASIASKVGVSINTVSRALRAPQTVRPDLRQAIRRAMEELNYVPNRLAGGLSGQRSNIVGVVVTSLYNSEFARVIDALQERLRGSGLQVMLANTRYDADEEIALVHSILSWRPAAVTIIGVDHPPKVVEMLRTAAIPVVEMWDACGDILDSAVGIDHEAVGRAQAEHLMARGYRHIAFVGSMRDADMRAQKRARGAAAALDAAGLGVLHPMTRKIGGSPQLGADLTRELLAAHPDIDGIICNSDVVGFGVLKALGDLGRTAGRDIGIVGFGDSDACAFLSPSLTSVRPDRQAIGERAAEIVISRIQGEPSVIEFVDWELIARASS